MSNTESTDPYANVLDNYLRYISNLEQNPRNDPKIVAYIKRVWRREMTKHPTIFAKVFSDDPKLFEEAKREVAVVLYKMEHPS